MKTFFLVVLLFFPMTFARAWEAVLECDHHKLVVDEECVSYRGAPCGLLRRQMVIRDQKILRYFVKAGVLPAQADTEHEFVTQEDVQRNDEYGSSFSAFIPHVHINGQKQLVRYYLSRNGSGLRLEAWKVEFFLNEAGQRELRNIAPLANWNYHFCTSHGSPER